MKVEDARKDSYEILLPVIEAHVHYLPAGDFLLEEIDDIDSNPKVPHLCQGYPTIFIGQVSLLNLMNRKREVVIPNTEK